MENSNSNTNSIHILLLIIGNILAWVSVIIVSILYASGKLNKHPESIIDNYPTKFTPAPWTFSIWDLIFILTGIFVVYQAMPTKRDSVIIFQGIGPLFILNYIFMFIWMFCFSYNFIWASCIFIFAALITNALIYIRIGIHYGTEGRNRLDSEGNQLNSIDFWLLQIPFSLSFGWLLLLTLSNLAIAVSTLPPSVSWKTEGWSLIFQIFVGILVLVILRVRHDPFFSIPISWGLFGIADKYRDDPVVSTSALVVAVLIGIVTIFTFFHIIVANYFRDRYISLRN